MKRFLRNSGICLMAVCTFLAAFSGCSSGQTESPQSSGTSNAPIVLNVGLLDAWSGSPTKYIVDQGLDKKAGIDIEYLVFSSGAPANEAMTAGEIDCAIIGGGASVPALASLNCKMVMEYANDSVGMSLIARPDLACTKVTGGSTEKENILGDADSVRGMKIITSAGTLQYYLAMNYIDALGLTADDVEIISMDANQGYQAFQLGEGDILACSSNYSYSLVQEGNIEVASLTSLGYATTCQLVCSDVAFNDSQKAKALSIYAKLLAETNDLMNSDTNLSTQCYVDWVTLNGGTADKENFQKVMEAKPYYGVEDIKAREHGKEFLDNFVGFYIYTGQIEEDQKKDISTNIRDDILKMAGLK